MNFETCRIIAVVWCRFWQQADHTWFEPRLLGPEWQISLIELTYIEGLDNYLDIESHVI